MRKDGGEDRDGAGDGGHWGFPLFELAKWRGRGGSCEGRGGHYFSVA